MRTILISILIILFSTPSFSQEDDFQTWHSFYLRTKSVNKTDFTLRTGLRLRENSSLYSKKFFDVKLRKKLDKRMFLSTCVRYATNWDKQFKISKTRRFYVDFTYKDKLTKRLICSIRNRWQRQADVDSYQILLRQTFSLQYNIRKTKLTPELATEYFLHLEDGINKLRSTISMSYPITKDLDFDIAYRIQNEFFANNPETLFIFEGKLSYDL